MVILAHVDSQKKNRFRNETSAGFCAKTAHVFTLFSTTGHAKPYFM
jgi:hypothetical protein